MKRLFDPALTVVCLGLMLTTATGFGYPVLGAEMLMTLAGSLLLAAVLTVATATFPALRMTVLGYLFLSMVVPAFVSGYVVSRIAIIGGAVVIALLHRRLPPHFFLAFALVFAPLKLHQDMRFPAPDHLADPPAGGADTQILVHLVMDEMGSFASVPQAMRDEDGVREIRAAYEKRGFRIHSDAPSVSWESKDSLGTLVDLGRSTGGLTNVEQIEGQYAFRILRNALHRLYAANGWQVSITQSSYLDFCRDPKWNCRTYHPGRNAHLFAAAGLPLDQRAMILRTLLVASLFGVPEPWRRTPELPLSALNEFKVLLAHAQTAHGKQYIFGHLLLPHFPWAVDAQCRVNAQDDWRTPDLSGSSEDDAYHSSLTRAYWQQTRCAHKKILEAVDALDAAHLGKVRFVIHGDHGPRIIRKALAPGEEHQVDDHARSMLEPFVATRLESGAHVGPRDAVTMQALLQKLLMSEAAVPAYLPSAQARSRTAPEDVRP